MDPTSTVLVTGASSGIGAVYADRFARRGHDVILVARDENRLAEVARTLRRRTDATVEVVAADLTVPSALAELEQRLRDDHRIDILVNNAGVSAPGSFAALSGERIDELIALNVTAPTRLTAALAPRLARTGRGAVVTVGSMVGLMPDYGQALYGATKAYLLFLSESLHHELGAEGVYLQAVLPAGTRTGIFTRTGRDVDAIPGLMDVEEMVDAALVGFDRRERVTMPSVPDPAAWERLDGARTLATASAAQSHAAARYRAADPAGAAGAVGSEDGGTSGASTRPSLLSVGLDPALIDARPGPPALGSLDHDTVLAGAGAAYDDLRRSGFEIDRCLLDLGATAETTYRDALADSTYEYICIGSGIRLDPALTHLFEMLVNVTSELDPHATLVFDTGPATKADAVRRWFPTRGPLEVDPYRALR